MYKCNRLQLICEKDTNIEHEIKYDMKKDVLNKRSIYLENNKNIKGKVENTYVIQGRAIFQEIARIRSELNCMHKHYSTLPETSVTKHQVLWHNSNIYICTGENEDKIIFLHETDWKIQMNNKTHVTYASCNTENCIMSEK